jgi:16S rRNA (adenine1518-N6/adenine1519-N6)-dimethyltransferase
VRRIVDAAEIAPGEMIVEIGPGRGALTASIAEQAEALALVEFDARTLSPQDLPEMADRRYKVIGNLPYYAAAPIVRNLLEQPNPPARLVVMVQREVAREMNAEQGKMGLLSVATQFYADTKIVCHAPPRLFSPPPRVHSTVIRLDVRASTPVPAAEVERFFTLARAGFAAPRKTLANSLAVGFAGKPVDYAAMIEQAGLDPKQRPATLSVEEWVALYAQLATVRSVSSR